MALRDYFSGGAAITAAIVSAAGLVGAFSSPFLGRFLDRTGPRVMFPLAGSPVALLPTCGNYFYFIAL